MSTESAGFELRIGSIGNHEFALAAHDRPRLVALQPGGALFGAQAIDLLRAARAIEEHDPPVPSRHEEVFGKGPGIAIIGLRGDRPGKALFVGSFADVDDGDRAVVIPPPVPGREDRHHFVRLRDRFGVDHHRAGMLVAEIHRLAGPVRIGRPEVVIADLRAIDVFPARDRAPARRAAARAYCLARCWRRFGGCCWPSASQRCMLATFVGQQLTQRLQRLEMKTIRPSGK